MVWSWLSCNHNNPIKQHLPEDIVIDILSRLPVEDLLSCKRVCRQWNSIIPTPYFNHLYLNRGSAVSTIVVLSRSKLCETKKLVCIEENKHHHQIKRGLSSWRSKKIIPAVSSEMLAAVGTNRFQFSHDGLLLFRGRIFTTNHTLMNPITQEIVTFDIPYCYYMGAFFFHPVAKEYYALLMTYVYKPSVKFRMLPLSLLLSDNFDDPEVTEEGWKNLINDNVSHVRPTYTNDGRSRAWTKDAIYWIAVRHRPEIDQNYCSAPCEESILVFDIKEEKFHLIAHPGEKCDHNQLNIRDIHAYMHLFDTNGHVSFCKFVFYDTWTTIDIWDHLNNYTWSLREAIRIDMTFKRQNHFLGIGNSHDVIPIGIINGELIISCENRSIDSVVLACNLQGAAAIRMLGRGLTVSHHSKTVVSLKNYSKIKHCRRRRQTSKLTRFLYKLKNIGLNL